MSLKSPSPRAGLTVLFATFGLAQGLVGGALSPLARQAGVDTAALGLAMTGFMLTYIAAMTIGGYLMSRFGSRGLLAGTLAAQGLLYVVFMQSGSVAMFFLLFAAFATASGLIDLVMNAEVASIERRLGRPILAFTHGTASIGYAIGAGAGSALAIGAGLGMVAAAGVVAVLLGLVAVVVALPPIAPSTHASKSRVHGYPFSLALVLIGIVVGVNASGEMSAAMWSGRLIEELSPDLAALGGLGATFFAGFQGLVRLMGDRLRRAFPDAVLVLASLAVAAVGFACVGLIPAVAGKFLGFSLIGIGSALIVPCGFAMGVATRPQMAAAALSTLALVAGLPRIGVPAAFGHVAGLYTVSTAYFVFAVLMAATVLLWLSFRAVQSR